MPTIWGNEWMQSGIFGFGAFTAIGHYAPWYIAAAAGILVARLVVAVVLIEKSL